VISLILNASGQSTLNEQADKLRGGRGVLVGMGVFVGVAVGRGVLVAVGVLVLVGVGEAKRFFIP
jgi:hypothetical protein